MPSTIERPEFIDDIQELRSPDRITADLPQRPGVVGHHMNSLKGQAEGQTMANHETPETVLDILATRHPYLYINVSTA